MLDYPNQRELTILSRMFPNQLLHELNVVIIPALKLWAKLLLHLIENLQLILDSSFTQYVQRQKTAREEKPLN